MSRILIIEDDEALLELMSTRLNAAGHDVSVATDALMGTKMALQTGPNVVLLDLKMPAGGGAAVLKSLRNSVQHRHIPVIVITGAQDPESMQTLRQFGIKTYIHKPFTPEELLAAVSFALPPASH